jgi:hypothetical protein
MTGAALLFLSFKSLFMMPYHVKALEDRHLDTTCRVTLQSQSENITSITTSYASSLLVFHYLIAKP